MRIIYIKLLFIQFNDVRTRTCTYIVRIIIPYKLQVLNIFCILSNLLAPYRTLVTFTPAQTQFNIDIKNLFS